MRMPRDLSGDELAKLLSRRYGYRIVRQRGSHMTLVAMIKGNQHSVTIPRHRYLRLGTLNSIVSDVSGHLNVSKDEVRQDLFGV